MEDKDRRAIAAGALLRYLDETQKNALEHITHLELYQATRPCFWTGTPAAIWN